MPVQRAAIEPPVPPACAALLAAAGLQDHLMSAGNDMDRLQRLLAGACDCLLAHFHGAAAEIESLLPADGEDGGSQPLRSALAHLRGAITAMQFQDMAAQLVAHTTRRLRGCADRLARDVMGDDEDGEALVDEPPLAPNPVTQDEMDAGSVELF